MGLKRQADEADRPGRALILTASLWGFAEATLFFVVPDVLLSFVALRRPRAAMWSTVYAVAGAIVGGVLMYVWGLEDPPSALATLERVPAVSAGMVASVGEELARHGVAAMFVGSFAGTPYKIYAVQCAIHGIDVVGFALASIPARLLRFALVVLLVSWIARVPARRLGHRFQVIALTAFWFLFYLVFWILMPG